MYSSSLTKQQYKYNTTTIIQKLKKSNAQGYDPKRSRVNDDTMMDFIRGTVTGDITDVPGIGPAAAKKLATGEGDEKVTNTYQLVGKVSEKKCEPEFV